MNGAENSSIDTSATGCAPRPLQSVYLEMLEPRLIAVEVGIIGGLVVLFAIIGPLGTDDTLALARRFAFWASCAVICWPLCHSQNALTLYFVRSRTPSQIVVLTTAGALFMAMPCAAVVTTVYELFQPNQTSAPGLADVYAVTAMLLVSCVSLIHFVACQRVKLKASSEAPAAGNSSLPVPAVKPAPAPRPLADAGATEGSNSAAANDPEPPLTGSAEPAAAPASRTDIAAPVRPGGLHPAIPPDALPAVRTDPPGSSERQDPHTMRAHSPPREPTRPPSTLLQRLPTGASPDIIMVKAAEHYIDVVTSTGSGLILMRFKDAVAELGDAGTQVHRSYWVAYRHISRIVRRDQRTVLHLSNGRGVPVSRTYRAFVRSFVDGAAASDGRRQ